MIRLENVVRRYGGFTAVDDLSMEVRQGEVCVLIGPSGCGKTTTLRMLNRLIEPTRGSIFVGGRETRTLELEQLRRSIGYVIQSVGLFPHMTVAANISVVPELLRWEKGRITERVQELLVLVGLSPDYSGKYPSQLSGGEAQRVGVARALAADPPILLMDEPFGAVDPLTRERLQGEFTRIQRELHKTVIFVTHDLDEAIRVADRIAVLRSGKLVQYDTPEDLLARPANEFVREFIGTEGVLKRLARIGIDQFIRPLHAAMVDAPKEEVEAAMGQRPLWVVDRTARLKGWVDRRRLSNAATVQQATVPVDPDDVAVPQGATVREALSRMLGSGRWNIPVVNEQRRLIGEITLADIEAATGMGESAR